MYKCKDCNWTGWEIFTHGVAPSCPQCHGRIEKMFEEKIQREQCFRQLRECLDFLEKSGETVHLPDNIIEISDGEWSSNENNIGQDIAEAKLADLMRYLVDMMSCVTSRHYR